MQRGNSTKSEKRGGGGKIAEGKRECVRKNMDDRSEAIKQRIEM